MQRLHAVEGKHDDLVGGAAADEAALTQLQQEVRDLKSSTSVCEEDLRTSGLADEIADCRTRKRSVKDRIVALNEELVRIEREGDKLKKLQSQQAAQDDKSRRLRAAVTERRPKLAAVIEAPSDDAVLQLLDGESLHQEVTRKLHARKEDLASKEGEVATCQDQLHRKGLSLIHI